VDASHCTTQPQTSDQDWAGRDFTVVPDPKTLEPQAADGA